MVKRVEQKMVRRRKSPPGYLYIIIIAVFVIGSLFILEWLGSEKQQTLVDKPIELPEQYQKEIDAKKAADEALEREGPGAI